MSDGSQTSSNCSICGARVAQPDRFCASCGAPVFLGIKASQGEARLTAAETQKRIPGGFTRVLTTDLGIHKGVFGIGLLAAMVLLTTDKHFLSLLFPAVSIGFTTGLVLVGAYYLAVVRNRRNCGGTTG